MTLRETPEEFEIDVCRVIITENNEQQIIFYKEVGGTGILPIVSGFFEATIITRSLERIPTPRPLTHDAWLSTIHEMGGEVVEVAILRLEDFTYFAEIRIKMHQEIVRIDVRPSDALAIAIKADVPIFANREVLESAST